MGSRIAVLFQGSERIASLDLEQERFHHEQIRAMYPEIDRMEVLLQGSSRPEEVWVWDPDVIPKNEPHILIVGMEGGVVGPLGLINREKYMPVDKAVERALKYEGYDRFEIYRTKYIEELTIEENHFVANVKVKRYSGWDEGIRLDKVIVFEDEGWFDGSEADWEAVAVLDPDDAYRFVDNKIDEYKRLIAKNEPFLEDIKVTLCGGELVKVIDRRSG